MQTRTKVERSDVYRTVFNLIETDDAKQAVLIVSPKLVVKATYILKPRKNGRTQDIRLTIGAPNFRARARIKQAVARHESFPLATVIKRWPKKVQA